MYIAVINISSAHPLSSVSVLLCCAPVKTFFFFFFFLRPSLSFSRSAGYISRLPITNSSGLVCTHVRKYLGTCRTLFAYRVGSHAPGSFTRVNWSEETDSLDEWIESGNRPADYGHRAERSKGVTLPSVASRL